MCALSGVICVNDQNITHAVLTRVVYSLCDRNSPFLNDVSFAFEPFSLITPPCYGSKTANPVIVFDVVCQNVVDITANNNIFLIFF